MKENRPSRSVRGMNECCLPTARLHLVPLGIVCGVCKPCSSVKASKVSKVSQEDNDFQGFKDMIRVVFD